MRKSIHIAVIAILIISTLFLLGQWLYAAQQIRSLQQEVSKNDKQHKIIAFTQLLTDVVLSGNQEISFEDRLSLEKNVRDLNDQEIFDQWQKFTKSTNDFDTQKNFTDLIKLLLSKISN